MDKYKKNQITIAIIGLLGVLATAVFSNWDKIFSEQKVVKAKYSGYRATGNFETELRYYFEVTGKRAAMEDTLQQIIAKVKIPSADKYSKGSEKINTIMKAALEDSMKYDKIIKMLIPVYRMHFTIEEIQELNKFYSTEIMQNMVKKMPVVTQELAPLWVELVQDYQKRI